MLANTMFPEAYGNGGPEVGRCPVVGFIVAPALVVVVVNSTASAHRHRGEVVADHDDTGEVRGGLRHPLVEGTRRVVGRARSA